MNPPRRRRFSLTRHKRAHWALPAFGVLLIAAIWFAMWLHLESTERALIGTTIRETESFVAAFERYTRRAIQSADRTARLVKHEFEMHGTLDASWLTQSGLAEGSEVVVVSIADASGNYTASTQPLGSINIADRENFRRHAEQDTGLLDISKPIVGRATGRSLIQLSRRVNHPDGSFAGIVLVSVTPEYFMAFYQDSDLGKKGSLGLLGLDGMYRARRVGEVATSVSDGSGPLLVTRAQASAAAHYEAQGDFDHVPRIAAYRELADYPLIVTAGRATDEALADFSALRANYRIIAAAATAVILAFFTVLTILAGRLQRHRAELQAQRRFLAMLVDNVPSGITVRSMQPDTMGQYVLYNESNALIFGTEADAALGRTVKEVMPALEAAHVVELDRQLLASPMLQDVVLAVDLPGRGRRIHHLIRAPIFGAQGQVDYIMVSTTDITEERERTDDLRLASKVFETTADAIVVSDAEDRVLMVNAAFTKLTGYDAKEIVGSVLAESPFRPIDVPDSDERMVRLHQDGFVTGEVQRFRKDRSPLSLWVTASCVSDADGTIRNYLRVFTDISLLKEAQQKLEQLASFDALTGLPNRRLFHDRLEQAGRRAQRRGEGMGVLFIDLDGFKRVNDTVGHDSGDRLLQEAAARLQQCIRASDSIGRLGGDEFAIVLEAAQLPPYAALVGERIVAAMAAPFAVEGRPFAIGASVGIAIYPDDGADAATLLKNADVAMYRAKQAGRGRYLFASRRADPAVLAG